MIFILLTYHTKLLTFAMSLLFYHNHLEDRIESIGKYQRISIKYIDSIFNLF